MAGYATEALKLNQWQHLACGFSFPNYFIYIDGIEVSDVASQTSLSTFNLNNLVRNSNFIGSSNWYNTNGGNDQHSDADFDDLKIFNRYLSPNEIQFEMKKNNLVFSISI